MYKRQLHDRQTGLRADIAQAQHSRAVGNDSHHVALEGVLVHVVGVFLDLALTVYQKGYKLGDKIVRHATVVVAE